MACRDMVTVVFQSTLPVWGATDVLAQRVEPRVISIHAPRVGSDLRHMPGGACRDISIHAPRVGSDAASNSAPDP